MTRCGVCGFTLEENERHSHIPDFYLSVANCRARLVRYREFDRFGVEEPLEFDIPDEWVDFILQTCGGSISMSGCYRLPGMIWEWLLLKCLGDEKGAEFLERRINQYLEKVT